MTTTQLQKDARQSLEEGRYEEAIALYEECVETEPNLASNYWYLGLAHSLCSASEIADSVWMSVLIQGTAEQIDAWTAELGSAIETIAVQYLASKRYETAQFLYEKIVEICPNLPSGYLGLYQIFLSTPRMVFWIQI